MAQDNVTAIIAAMKADLGRSVIEVVYAEINAMVACALFAAENFEEWAKPDKPQVDALRSSWNTTVYKAPKGVVICISYVLFAHIECPADVACKSLELSVVPYLRSFHRCHCCGLHMCHQAF